MTKQKATALINATALLLACGKAAPSIVDEVAEAIGTSRAFVTAMIISSMKHASSAPRSLTI